MNVEFVLLGISIIIIFGFVAELIFKKTGIPDVLLLLILGYFLGPQVFHMIDPASFAILTPVFTTFALLFLMFEGSLSIDLASFAKGLFSGSIISLFNFIVSALTVALILFLGFGFDILNSLLTGFILGGISSAFVIPIIKQMSMRGEFFTIMTLEAALSDVYTIVFSLTVLQIIKLDQFSSKEVLTQVVSLFAIAFLIGVLCALIWIFLDKHVFSANKSYMSLIAFVILVYLLAGFLGGNGAIAALFFGITLKNSKQVTRILNWITIKNEKEQKNFLKTDMGLDVLSVQEHQFFNQISFFLKVFFFVYIGLLFNVKNREALIIGLVLAIAILVARRSSMLFTTKLSKEERSAVNGIFARGLAAAAVAQIIISSEVVTDPRIIGITYVFIVASIFLSSINVLIHKRMYGFKAAEN